MGAGACQLVAIVLLWNSHGFKYGGRKTLVILFMLAALVLAGFALVRYHYPVTEHEHEGKHETEATVTDLPTRDTGS